MNKLSMVALTGLMLCGVHNVSAMGQEQREILYTLHALGQNFADVPMVFQNIDMFIGVEEMNIQINQLKLKDENQKLKTVVLKNAALLGGILLAQYCSLTGLNKVRNAANPSGSWEMWHVLEPIRTMIVDGFIVNDLLGLVTMGKVFAALNVYDAWKKRSELMQALALDEEILGILQKIKASMEFIEENADSTENFLLRNPE